MNNVKPLAVLADIHGNRWALKAVLQNIRQRGIEEIVNLGDCFYGPLDPGGTADILLDLDIPAVRGNEDRILVDYHTVHDTSPSLRFTRDNLEQSHIQWLKKLQSTIVFKGCFYMCHGTPQRDNEYLLSEVTETGVSLRKPVDLIKKLSSANVEEKIILCGHDHVPRTVYLPDGRLIVNPGSVGLPAYSDDFPFYHSMETGTPHARYSIICKKDTGWLVENIAIPYDWETAARKAARNGRRDWAKWLSTGRATI